MIYTSESWHLLLRKWNDIIETSIENNSLDFRVVISEPRDGKTADTPREQDDVLWLESERESVLHDGIGSCGELSRIGLSGALSESRVVPAERRVATLDGQLEDAVLVERSVAVAANHQILAVFGILLAIVCRVLVV